MPVVVTILVEDLDECTNREDNSSVVAMVNRLNAPLLRRAGLLLAEVSGFGRARSENATGKRSHAKRKACGCCSEGRFPNGRCSAYY